MTPAQARTPTGAPTYPGRPASELDRMLGAGLAADVSDAARLAAGRAAARAVREGVADIAYAPLDSPLGPLIVAATRHGLVRLGYADGGCEPVLNDLAARLSPRIVEVPAALDPVRRELDEYFAGRRQRFELAIDWALVGAFGRRVLRATAAIPFGEVATYAGVAARAGNPRAARAAGNALGANPLPIVVPCHRVLRAGGGLGGYTGGLDRKRHLLRLEGTLAP